MISLELPFQHVKCFQLDPEYSNRVIIPANQESLKRVTARFNAEELITNRETVKNQIEEQIKARLAPYNVVVDALSITEFALSQQFTTTVESKVEAQQRALQVYKAIKLTCALILVTS